MPKLPEKITDKLVRSIPAPEKGNVLHYDPELKGFAVRVTAAGVKAFVLVYHFGKAERRDTIGSWPAWQASAARTVAKAWRRDVDLGVDPRGAPEPQQADEMLFLPLAEQFLVHGRTKRGRLLRPTTKREYCRALLVYAKPLHSQIVTEIRRSAVSGLITAVASQHGTTSAMRFRAALSRFFGWLVPRIDDLSNPVTGTEGYETPKGERVLYDALGRNR
jgi:Arm DNA-binding domain/Phage integrase, N-terminal SAM-like domain